MMANPATALVAIPARMASTRLPGKALADIAGEPMIVHVWRRGVEADLGPVLVACAEPEIAEAVRGAGGEAVLTDPDHASGSDRIHEAVTKFDPDRRYDVVVNLQGDLPNIDPAAIRLTADLLATSDADISTLAVEITDDDARTAPGVVKAVISLAPGARSGQGLYFTRVPAPSGDGPLYHHIGIYGYRRAALERFVALPPGHLEQREKLEQLRALENGMRIVVGIINKTPFEVNTPDDLEGARRGMNTTKPQTR